MTMATAIAFFKQGDTPIHLEKHTRTLTWVNNSKGVFCSNYELVLVDPLWQMATAAAAAATASTAVFLGFSVRFFGFCCSWLRVL